MKSRIASILKATCLCLVLAHPTTTVLAGVSSCPTVVVNTLDNGPGSLRFTLNCADPGATITFDTNGVFAVPQTIVLTSGEIGINKSQTILGPGANRVSVSGNHSSRVFHIGQTAGPAAALPPPINVTIAGLTITNGNTVGSGGGIFNDHSTLTVSNCVLAGNLATQAGAIQNFGGASGSAALTLVDSAVIGNTATLTGGAIFSDGIGAEATLTIRNSIISHNHASNDAGGIHNIGQEFGNAIVTIENSTISSNTANEAAGIMNNGAFSGNVSLTIINSTIDGNVAVSHTAAIWNDGEQSGNATLTIRNSTISGNSAGIVHHSILNDAANSGSATFDIGSTIFQVDAGMTNIHNDAGNVISQGYNLSSDNSSTFLNQSTDQNSKNPLLGPLQDNGGQTPTRALLCGSPAIDAGTNFLALTTDQRGFARTVGDATDVGAVELAGLTYTVLNTNNSGAGSLRQAILDANAHAGADTIVFDSSVTNTITLTSGELLITDCLFIDGPGATNVAVNGNAAGRVFHIGSNTVVTIAGLTITNGAVLGPVFPSGTGGGIYNELATLTVSNCTVSGNSASVFGGGICNDGGSGGSASLTVVNSTLSGNSASRFGGGIFNAGYSGNTATVEVVNSTISSNLAELGGGIFNDGVFGFANLQIANCTLSGNSSAFLVAQSEGCCVTLTIGSTILDAGASGSISNTLGTVISLGYNLSSDAGGGVLTNTTDLVNTNALLGPLQLNGGQTPTHALLSGSPAIDAGTNFTDSATDQRDNGFLRTVGAATDIGAFEVQTVPNQSPVAICTNITVSADTNCMTTVNVSDVDNGSNDPDSADSITLSFSSSSVVSNTTLSGTGAHSVTLYVTDNHGLQDSCVATVTIKDATPPTITCPSNQVANATSPSGAVVNYPVAVASDNCGVISSLTYSKNSGTVFPIGTTTVTSRAIDDSSNTNSCTFTVKVKSASEQITDLIALVNGLSGVKNATKNALIVKLNAAQKALKQGNIALACSNLKDFISLALAQMGKKEITAAQANLLIAEATRIRAVLACP